MKNREKILITLFSALVLLVAVTLTGCFGDEEGGGRDVDGNLRLLCSDCHEGRYGLIVPGHAHERF